MAIAMNTPMMLGSNFINSLSMFSSDNGDYSEMFKVVPAIPTKYTLYNMFGGRISEGIYGKPVFNGGLYPRLCNIIGESATGKSSLLASTCASSVDYITNRFGLGYAELFYFDVEKNMDAYRFCDLAGWSPADFQVKCQFSHRDLTMLELADFILKKANNKMKYSKDYLLNSGIKDIDGREILFLAPTFICVDSIAAVNPDGAEKLLEKDKAGEVKDLTSLGNNMEAAQEAKAWTIFVRKMKPWLDKGNIGLFFINHKTKEIQTSMYEKQTRYLPFLGMGEKLKGGKEFIFQSYNVLSLSSGEKINSKNPVYGNDINGFVARAMFVKNKANIEGEEFPMVFDQNLGYIAELSDLEYLYQKKYGFEGAVKMKMDVLPELEFTRRSFMEMIQEYPQLARAVQFTTKFHSSNTLHYRCNPGSLKDFGTNIPLEQRLSILYNFTNSYGKVSRGDNPYINFMEIAHANRHYYSFDFKERLNEISPTNAYISSASKKYTITGSDPVSPYDVDDGKATIVNVKYVSKKR